MKIRTKTNHRSSSGFTFVETMVSILIGSVMLAALYASFAFGYGAVKLAREDLRATQIMLQRQEMLRLTSFSAIQAGTFTEYFDPSSVTNGCQGAIYTITVTTNAPTASDMPVQPVYYMNKMRKVTVTATWTNSNQLRTRSLITYASQNGIQNYVYAHR
jgi:prepilin-type N-terminal cleavage/methylation domain-containing protein